MKALLQNNCWHQKVFRLMSCRIQRHPRSVFPQGETFVARTWLLPSSPHKDQKQSMAVYETASSEQQRYVGRSDERFGPMFGYTHAHDCQGRMLQKPLGKCWYPALRPTHLQACCDVMKDQDRMQLLRSVLLGNQDCHAVQPRSIRTRENHLPNVGAKGFREAPQVAVFCSQRAFLNILNISHVSWFKPSWSNHDVRVERPSRMFTEKPNKLMKGWSSNHVKFLTMPSNRESGSVSRSAVDGNKNVTEMNLDNNALLVKIEGPVWYTIYHHYLLLKGFLQTPL